MIHGSNLRKTHVDGELYVNVRDLLKLLDDIMHMEGLNPESIKTLDGLGMGLALTLNVVSVADLPENVQTLIRERYDHDNADSPG